MQLSQSYQQSDQKPEGEGTRPFIVIALLVGVLMLGVSYHVPEGKGPIVQTLKDLIRDFGIVLISVWGVSLFYERFLAARHFQLFHRNLQALIRQGETNAAACEALGILEIHRTRRSYEEKHSFANQAESVGPGDMVRIIGRSLIFSIYDWPHLSKVVENGATLSLCLCDPGMRKSPLDYLSGYSPKETDFAVDLLLDRVKPWLESVKPKGTMEVRFHQVHLLDSLLEVKTRDKYRIAWDLNFGQGTQERQIFYVNGRSSFGRNLTAGRYALIWENSTTVLRYSPGVVETNLLSPNSLAGALEKQYLTTKIP